MADMFAPLVAQLKANPKIPSKDLTVIRCRIPICDEVDHRIN